MEELDYLIRTFTYKRSCAELALKRENLLDERTRLTAIITTLGEVLSELYLLALNHTPDEG